MMHEMKNRNNSYSRHGDNKMDKMRMMMKMMKMSNMMNDHSSSSYRSDDNDMYDMFSEMLDSSSDRMDNYRSSDYSNQMGRAEAPHGGQDRQHDLCHEGVECLGRQQQHRCPGHEEGHPEVHDAQRVVQEQVRAPASHLLRDGHQPARRHRRELRGHW